MADRQTLGKYHILEEIGRGGFAAVYRAHITRLSLLELSSRFTGDSHNA